MLARNNAGAMVSGTMEAANQAGAGSGAARAGPCAQPAVRGARLGDPQETPVAAGRIKIDDMVIFSRQLAVMIRAGLPLIEVLNILGEQLEKRTFQDVIRQVEHDVESGSSFTEALQRHPRVFNPFFLSMVRAGEGGRYARHHP